MNLELFKDVFEKYEINTPLRKAHFLAQIHHESNGMTRLQESLNYSVDGLLKTFSRSRISKIDAYTYGRTDTRKANQQMIANIVYGGRFGKYNLGNEDFGDGWRFRGRGPLMCTGYAMYLKYKEFSGVDVILDPDLMATKEVGLDFAGYFWTIKRINKLADKDDLKAVTKAVNGGYIGLEDRLELLNKYKVLLNVTR